jgi:hypothetical protein
MNAMADARIVKVYDNVLNNRSPNVDLEVDHFKS